MITSILLLITAYVLGSIPFGYLITKYTAKKKSLTSDGPWQKIFIFVFDVAKGWLAVYLARYFGLPLFLQVGCGALVFFGHNWSCFLKFKGGRGLATLTGALFVISPTVLLVSLIPCVIFTIIWTASVGTILSFLTGVIFSFSLKGYEWAGLLIFISLIPVLIKRLNPIKELRNNPNYKELMENRLLFDQDTVPPIRFKIKKNN